MGPVICLMKNVFIAAVFAVIGKSAVSAIVFHNPECITAIQVDAILPVYLVFKIVSTVWKCPHFGVSVESEHVFNLLEDRRSGRQWSA